MPAGATTLPVPASNGWNGQVDDQDEVTVLDVVGPELARCSELADRLAALLLPASLFS